MVQVSNLALTYQSAEGEIEAIRDLSFSVADGEFVSVIGPSGCGKSTLLSIIAGLLSPTAGEIRLAGDGSIGYMLQKDSLFPWRTIRRNVLLGAEIKGGGLRAAEEYADSLLKTYGLWEFRDCFPGQLSGGMRQRAAFGRTALTGSKLLLLDEPFSALDFLTRVSMQEWLLGQWQRHRQTVLFITHDVEEAIFLSGRILVVDSTPIRRLTEVPVPLPYPRERTMLSRPEIAALRERLLDSLRKQVKEG